MAQACRQLQQKSLCAFHEAAPSLRTQGQNEEGLLFRVFLPSGYSIQARRKSRLPASSVCRFGA